MSNITASIEPAAREVFERRDGQSFPTPAQFGSAFTKILAQLGPMPRFFSSEEAIDWAARAGVLRVGLDGVIAIRL